MNICEVSKICGGCTLQGIEYKKQLSLKQEKVSKLFNTFRVKKIIGMDNPYNYRNKVQVSLYKDEHNHIHCGNYINSSHIVVDVDDCMISNVRANEIINSIKRLVIKHKISIFNEELYKGCLRHILIRCTNTNEYMVVLVTGSVTINKKDDFIKDILFYNRDIKTIVQNINNKHTSMVLGEKNIILYGKGYVTDILCGLFFRISAKSFYQVNSRQTEILYKEAIKAADPNKDDVVIDAYCGTGTIGLCLANKVNKVIGVELNASAIRDALTNMKINDINNVEFICADAGKFMSNLAHTKTKVDTVIMDPPRTGSDMKFMNSLVKLKPKKLVYVSCNPLTLKDNLKYLTKYYTVEYIQPVDMFPFTDHVECVVGMQRK